MLARSFRSRHLLAVACLALAGCASPAPMSQGDIAPVRVPSLTPTSRVLDAERIRRSGAQTAWDAIRMLVPRYRLHSNLGSSVRAFNTFDAIPFESSLRLVIDGHHVGDFGVLQAIPAGDVVAIHVLNPTEAATQFGTGIGDGAIVILTRSALVRR